MEVRSLKDRAAAMIEQDARLMRGEGQLGSLAYDIYETQQYYASYEFSSSVCHDLYRSRVGKVALPTDMVL